MINALLTLAVRISGIVPALAQWIEAWRINRLERKVNQLSALATEERIRREQAETHAKSDKAVETHIKENRDEKKGRVRLSLSRWSRK